MDAAWIMVQVPPVTHLPKGLDPPIKSRLFGATRPALAWVSHVPCIGNKPHSILRVASE